MKRTVVRWGSSILGKAGEDRAKGKKKAVERVLAV